MNDKWLNKNDWITNDWMTNDWIKITRLQTVTE